MSKYTQEQKKVLAEQFEGDPGHEPMEPSNLPAFDPEAERTSVIPEDGVDPLVKAAAVWENIEPGPPPYDPERATIS